MATYTQHYNLKKPEGSDFYNIDDFNGNADAIDSALHTIDGKATYTAGNGISITNNVISSTVKTSNPNLLDNPWFTVNTRGGKIILKGTNIYTDISCTSLAGASQNNADAVTRISNGNYAVTENGVQMTWYVKASDVVDGYVGSDVYSIDRWVLTNGKTLVINDDKTISLTTNQNTWVFLQIFNSNSLGGKTVTYSVDVTNINGNWRLFLQYDNEQQYTWVDFNTVGIKSGVIAIPSNKTVNSICLQALDTGNSTITIRAIKLELGSVSTLANDTAPNIEEEKLKCSGFDSKFDKSGGKIDGSVLIQNGSVTVSSDKQAWANILATLHGAYLRAYDNNDIAHERQLFLGTIANYSDIKTALRLVDKGTGTQVIYDVLHTGNMSANNYQKIVNTTTAPTVGASSTYPNGTLVVVYE